MKKLLSALLAGLMLVGLLSMTGCGNTLDGIGRDIEKMGKEIQD